jgi:L-threonylcarbamoyladenylate synthase
VRTIAIDEPGALDAAEAALRDGGAVVLPTDTVYGLAALPAHGDLLHALKDRPAGMPIAVLVADVEQAAGTGRLDGAARRLADRFWPGPLTLVLPGRDGGPTVGVRCPDHEFLRSLAARVGPIPTTSANRHGEPTSATAAAAAASLAGAPALVIDGGECAGVASTVVDTTTPEPTVLREGAVPSAAVAAALT